MKHIIFCDIDGTLYDYNQTFHPNTIGDINVAQSLGIEFMIATGNGVFDKVKSLSNLTKSRYLITSNGASIYDSKEQKFILKEIIPANIANEILQFGQKNKIACNWWDEDNVYTNEYQTQEIRDLIDRVMLPVNGTQVVEKITDDIFKIEFYDEPDKIDKVEKFLEPFGLQTARMKPNHIEITHVGVSKGAAAKFMAEKLNVDLKHCMAIGDSSNDLPMFEVVGHSYAMADGGKHVHDAANHHTSSVEQNGLGEAIHDYIYREKIAK